MERREFLKAGLLGGAATVLGVTEAANVQPAQVSTFELDEATIADLQSAMRSGSESAQSIAEKYLERIEAVDRNGPKVNSVIEVNPDAVPIAQKLDLERKEGKIRGPLHGIPVVIKDNIETADRMKTTAGSLALLDNIAERDAFISAKLRQSGAVILGKANLSEWANFRSTKSSSGWSGRGGRPRTLMLWIEIPAEAVRDPEQRLRQTFAASPSVPKPTVRSSARPRPTAWWGSSPLWDWFLGLASFLCPTAKTPQGRCAER